MRKIDHIDWTRALTLGSGSIVDHENDEQLESSGLDHELDLPDPKKGTLGYIRSPSSFVGAHS